jgi:methionine-rich copper-binding protein CopC
MKKHYLLAVALVPLFASAQLKQIAFSELTAGSGMFFGAEMSTTTITVTVQGPADRFIAFGFGTGMSSGNDAIIWSTLGTGAAPLQLRDHRMVGTGVEPTVDAQQDWTVISNDVAGGNRTIVASRALSTGDANDVTFNFASTTQNLFWAKSASASNQIAYHGGNRASGIVRNWVLVDQTPPLLNTTTPADNASGVSLTANLIMSFNEPISWNTGSITLYDENDNVVQTVSSGSPNVNIVGGTLSFNPTANLIVNTDYYVHVDPTALKDAAGNAFAGFTDNTTWNFNTNDVTAPALAASGALSPADNAVAVALTTDLAITFNENVQLGASGLIELFDETNTLVESFDVAASSLVTVSNATVTINPTNDLLINTDYYVHIASGAIEDISGNDYAGFSNNTTWNFNTNDIVAPTAVPPFTPADNATGVATTGNLSISFSEDIMIPATGALSFTLFEANGTAVAILASGNPGLSVTGNTLNVTAGALSEQTSYYVNISAGFIQDLAGNNFAGISDQTTWNFTTGDFTAPALAAANALDPADNATEVPLEVTPSVTFNEPIALGSGNIVFTNETTGATMTFDAATSSNLVVSGPTLTIDATLPVSIQHFCHITIDPGAITDLSGNDFAGITDTTAWSFFTVMESGLDELTAAGIQWDGTTLTIAPQTKATVNLLDASGKIVKANLGHKTNCSDLTTGVYLVAVRTETNAKTVRIYVR